jgi:hypothetical protein
MKADCFDSFSRFFGSARSRRGLTRLLAGLVLGGSLALRRSDGTKAKGKKGSKKRRKKRATTTVPPLPLPPISCLDPTLPNVCARTYSCRPACAPDKAFDPVTCRCLCRNRQQCCECLDAGTVDLCFNFTVPGGDAEDCQNVCLGQGLAASRFVSVGIAECSSTGAVGCTTICSDDP